MATVLVVGASRGIGLEFVRQYAAEGNRVIATHRSEEAGAKLRELGAKPTVLDMLDEGAVLDFGEKMANEKIDIAIINAGVAGPRGQAVTSPGGLDFDAVMHTNVRAPMQLIPALGAGLDRVARQARRFVEPHGFAVADDEHRELALSHQQGGIECGTKDSKP